VSPCQERIDWSTPTQYRLLELSNIVGVLKCTISYSPGVPQSTMLAPGPSQSPATPQMRKARVHHDQPETSESLEQRMQNMIDMQYAYTESFRENVGTDMYTGTANDSTHNKDDDGEHNDNRALNAPNLYDYSQNNHEESQDPLVGRGQLIFSNSYYQQQNMQLHPPNVENPRPYEGYNTIESHDETLEDDHHAFVDYYMNDTAAMAKEPCCCCLWDPFVNALQNLLHADHLHRSFCDAAIDGMLTGAGLVAALAGFGFFPLAAPPPWVVAVCFTACVADALCMALGHVWTTHAIASQDAKERRDERMAFARNRNASKAKLVDLLLARGMLKIDAVSIADTLEGYPDIFVGALVGDSVVLSPPDDVTGYPNSPQYNNGHNTTHTITNYNRTLADSYRFYGQFNEWDHDPDAAHVAAAVAESRTEGVVMCLAFSLFGSVPAALYYFVSCWASNTQAVSARSAAMTLTSIVMWMLGMWKRYVLNLESLWLLDHQSSAPGGSDVSSIVWYPSVSHPSYHHPSC
jgi:VIT family